MALTATEEAQVKALIAQNAALLSLASSEPTIISKLAATKVSLADLTAASTVSDSDLFLVRQGSTEKSITKSVLAPIATNAEAQAFTAGKLIDGAKLAAALQGANQSLAQSGFQKMPGGLILQWGRVTSSINSTTTITLPIAFSNLFAGVLVTPVDNIALVASDPFSTAVPLSLSTFSLRSYYSNSVIVNFWVAIGF